MICPRRESLEMQEPAYGGSLNCIQTRRYIHPAGSLEFYEHRIYRCRSKNLGQPTGDISTGGKLRILMTGRYITGSYSRAKLSESGEAAGKYCLTPYPYVLNGALHSNYVPVSIDYNVFKNPCQSAILLVLPHSDIFFTIYKRR